VGISYDRETWSAFANGELKALGALQYRSWIVQAGVALPFDIGRSLTIISHRRTVEPVEPKPVLDDETPTPKPVTRPRASPASPEQAPPDMIFLK
jgi:hypothetical protein